MKTASQQSRVAQKLSDANGATLSKIDGFSERTQRKLGRALARGESPKKVADGGQNYVDLLDDLDDVDSQTARRLDEIERSGEDVAPLVRAYQNGEIDGNDLRRASKLLDSRGGDFGEYYVSDDVSASDLAKIADDGADLSTTEVVVKPKNTEFDSQPKTIWLELGDATEGGDGWLHIATRHVTASQDGEQVSSLFPVGQTVQGTQIPNTLSIAEVKELIYLTVRHGQTSGGSARGKVEYMMNPQNHGFDHAGISQMRVVMQPDGSIETSFPEKGTAVRRVVPGQGVRS